MASNLTTYASLLKRAYATGVAEQINQEILLYDLFTKSSKEWVGEQLFYAVHTRRAGTAANIGDGGTLPTAGSQTDKNLVVTAKTIADRVQVSTKLMKAAPSAGSGAFLGYMDGAINRLIDDVKDLADRRLFDGGVVKGILNEHKASAGNTAAAFVGGGAGNGTSNTHEYSGDLSSFGPFAAVVKANTNTWVRVNLRRMDTYALIVPTLAGAATAAKTTLMVSDFSQANGTIELTLVSDDAGCNWTSVIGIGFGLALELSSTQLTDGIGANFGTVIPFALEQEGILTNLTSGTHKSVDRTSATGEDVLQASIHTVAAVVGGHVRAALSSNRMQAVLDNVNDKSGKDPTLFIMNAKLRSKYQAILVQTTQAQVQVGAKKGDVGFSGFAFNGQDIRVSRHCANGLVLFLSPESFEVAEYDAGGWMDRDGSMLSRVANAAAYEAAYTWDWDLVCTRPNANGILCGISI